MNPSNECHFCGSKGKRQCPAVSGMICPQCCGSKRGTEISCPVGCHYYPFSPSQYDAFLPIEASFDRKSLQYIVRHSGEDKWYETRDRMVASERDTEADDIIANGSAAYYLLFYEKNDSGRTLAEEWEREEHLGLNNDERIILKARKSSSATVIEIQKILDHQTMECLDLFDQNRPPFPVIDRRTAQAQMPRFTRILTWLDDYPYFSRLGAGGIILPDTLRREGIEIFERLVKRRGKPDEKTIKRYLSENFGEAARMLTDYASEKVKSLVRSMDVHECIAVYDIVRGPEKIKEILETYPEFQKEDECDEPNAVGYTWLRVGRSKAIEKFMSPFFRHKKGDEGVGTLGKIRLYPDKIEVVAFSKQKYEFAKKMAEKYFGTKIRLRRESVVDLAKQVANRDREDFEEDEGGDSEEMPESIPPEIRQKVMEEFFRQHYTKFLDDSVPALKGMTPRQAAKDLLMRPRLAELMKEHICGIEAQNKNQGLQINLDWVLEELGLMELKL